MINVVQSFRLTMQILSRDIILLWQKISWHKSSHTYLQTRLWELRSLYSK